MSDYESEEEEDVGLEEYVHSSSEEREIADIPSTALKMSIVKGTKRAIREEFAQFIEFYVTSETMPDVTWSRDVDGVPETFNDRFWLTVTVTEDRDTFKVSLEIWDPKADTDSGEFSFLIKNETSERTETVFLSISDYDPDNCVEIFRVEYTPESFRTASPSPVSTSCSSTSSSPRTRPKRRRLPPVDYHFGQTCPKNVTPPAEQLYGPQFIEKLPVKLETEEEEKITARFEFRISSPFPPLVSWTRNTGYGTQKLLENDRIKMVLEVDKCTEYTIKLVIQKVKKLSDQGFYLCTARTNFGVVEADFELALEKKVTVVDAPVLTRGMMLDREEHSEPPITIVEVGFTSKIPCRAIWFGPDGFEVLESNGVKLSVEPEEGKDAYRAQLRILDESFKMSGTFNCVIENENGDEVVATMKLKNDDECGDVIMD